MNGRKVALIMDNFSGHQAAVAELEGMPEAFQLQHVTVIWLPSNSTSKTQPLDQGVIASFKANYRKLWLQYLLDEYNEGREGLTSMNILKAIRWSIRAWHEVTPETIHNCWMHSYLNPFTTQAKELRQANAAIQNPLINNPQGSEIIEDLRVQVALLLN